MLKIAQSPEPVSMPNAAIAARIPLTMPPATKAGIIEEKIPVIISNIRALPLTSKSLWSGSGSTEPASFPLPSIGSSSLYTDSTLVPIITCHCPSLTCAPKAPSSFCKASRSAFDSSLRLKRRRVMQWVAVVTLSDPPTSSSTRAASSFLSAMNEPPYCSKAPSSTAPFAAMQFLYQ